MQSDVLLARFKSSLSDTLRLLDESGYRYDIIESHSGFGAGGSSVGVLVKDAYISLSNHGFEVKQRGIRLGGFDCPEKILALVSSKLGMN